MANSNSTSSFPHTQTIQPTRIGLFEVIRNRFTGRSYLVPAAPLALPAPIAAEQSEVIVYPATSPARCEYVSRVEQLQAEMLSETGAATLADAFQIRMANFLAERAIGGH